MGTRYARYDSTRRRKGQTRAQDPFWALVATARRLQAPGGCAWDRAQTVRSLLPYLVEEVWEAFETVRSRRYDELEEELGDVLYCVLFLTLIGERRGWCRLESLLNTTRLKMVRRHPHVFGAQRAGSPAEAYRRWNQSKRLEGPRRHSPSKALRQQLVAWWDWLHAHPEAVRARPPLDRRVAAQARKKLPRKA